MYREYFGLTDLPFSIAPDPRYLYMSDQHREALAHLVYGLHNDGGFVLLTGEVGTGKTTICRCFLEQLPENTDIAFVLNPKLSVEELLATICDELGIRYPEGNTSIKVFVDHINEHLLDAHARGRKTVLILEEAQNLSADVLEQVRLLTNLETNQCKLLQIIMLGQPELKDMLSRPELRQLAQRITARYHLCSLSKKEVAAYINHRLAVAGAHSRLFPPSTIGKLFRLSGGIPRLINLLCDRALLGAYVQGQDRVDKPTLSKASCEIFGKTNIHGQPKKTFKWVLASLVLIGCVVMLAMIYYNHRTELLALITPKPVQQTSLSEPIIEQPQLSLLYWPANQPIHRSNEMAYQSLLKQWDVLYKPHNGSVCQQARTQGLGCLKAQGSLRSLLHLNRPAVLKLFNDQGQEFYALLTALRGQTAIFVMGTETRTVDVKEIEKKWLGDYMLLWRMPPDYKSPLHPGQEGKVVQWLDRQLSLSQGRTVQPLKSLVFDNKLVREVKKFQLAKGLVPDGIVGAHTIIHLNNEVGSREPVLVDNKENK
ncbi:MAG: AAA family ATPase [Nitrospirota bacterium]|nr:AAA family ATPase [Nitrospirota bacterium]MDH5767509.1 AAA family ATPase [Nitrospirota bacterium]